MGTSACVKFCYVLRGDIFPLVNVYHHYDGYPEWVGKQLCEWLIPKLIVDGFSRSNSNICNGIGCMAAMYIRDHKMSTGNFYVTPLDDKGEYNYIVIVEGTGKANDCITIIALYDDDILFKGKPSEFLNYIKRKE